VLYQSAGMGNSRTGVVLRQRIVVDQLLFLVLISLFLVLIAKHI
jgi:hypothetical protein